MPPAYGAQIRWLVIYKRFFLDESPARIEQALHVSLGFQKMIIRRFLETGDVMPTNRGGAPRTLQAEHERAILHAVLDSPTTTLQQHSDQLLLSHGMTVSVSTLCRAMRRMNLSYRTLQHYALRRDELRAEAFWTYVVTYYPLDRLLVGDETAKQPGVLRRHMGWGPVGLPVYDRDLVLTRGTTVSCLTYFSTRGFEDWTFTRNTFNAQLWQEATSTMLMTPKPELNGETLASQFDALLLDNAKIHKQPEFLQKLNSHIKVLFIPPYCYHLSPLDNGAYGYVVRYLRQHAQHYARMPIQEALSDVFENHFSDSTARMCFYNCFGHP